MCFICLTDNLLITYYSSDIVKQKRSWPPGLRFWLGALSHGHIGNNLGGVKIPSPWPHSRLLSQLVCRGGWGF